MGVRVIRVAPSVYIIHMRDDVFCDLRLRLLIFYSRTLNPELQRQQFQTKPSSGKAAKASFWLCSSITELPFDNHHGKKQDSSR